MTVDVDQPSATCDLELSVIIPARNEEISLPGCLASLVRQSEPGFELGRQWELIVVNDDSDDATASIVRALAALHAGVTLMEAPPLDLSESTPFTGKNNACWAGAKVARGQWLLFTDADTIHEPDDLSRSLREAERHHVALLSYSPRQVVTGFWQRVVMPLVFSELASVYRMAEVNDPGSSLAAANGQFLLIDRDAYFAVGGHRAVASDVLEDVALARTVKQSQRPIRFRYAPDALSTHMYRTTAAMIEGWTKNLAVLFPRPIYLAAWRVLDFALYFCLPLLAFGIPWLVNWQRWALMLLWGRTLWRFYARVARSNFPAVDVTLSILGIPLFVFLLVRSTLHHRMRRTVVWKGRSYRTS
ncbi:glycosyltransferase [Edaphobacter modestus]|uniref:Cellulose synthase/poly-beta-1,6-N-acetylglucosamine synthase-like glycosyltransferase n=1 Tax=Edaphobacter modestus TaxID=388466 RepID=A0A4Q7YQ26_9BACT|nr:glycosyltransferase family 2 protein [Edaphobacter modestus]RZU39797.1 cellulose synthase/poly-beta-1,6-N-acetylglucosamine synthase-like glycosyltransferase [Edaphobacter modestus]